MELKFKRYHEAGDVIGVIEADLEQMQQEEQAIKKTDYREITSKIVQRLTEINTRQDLLPATLKNEIRQRKRLADNLHSSVSECAEILESIIGGYKAAVMDRMTASLVEEGVPKEEALKMVGQSKRIQGLQHLLGPTLSTLVLGRPTDFSNSDQSRKGLLPIIEEGLKPQSNFDKLVTWH